MYLLLLKHKNVLKTILELHKYKIFFYLSMMKFIESTYNFIKSNYNKCSFFEISSKYPFLKSDINTFFLPKSLFQYLITCGV